MAHSYLIAPLFILLALVARATAFTAATSTSSSVQIGRAFDVSRRTLQTGSSWNQATTTTRHRMLPSTAADAVNSLLIATIDSDIASIPENEFAPVFAGGVVVMFGGLLSALFVGWLIDSRNLYANIVADSYAQSADDEEFWKGLSEEEKVKTQELLKRLKASKSGGTKDGMAALEVLASAESVPSDRVEKLPAPSEPSVSATEVPSKEKKDTAMFSDY